jgi:riboflavin kinase/FMN adenylyltransferase
MRLIRLTAEYITRALIGDTRLPQGAVSDCCLSLGAFDGFHRGHQKLVQKVLVAKESRHLKSSCLFTFRRHPRLILQADPPPFLLTTWREKLSLLTGAGLDVVVAVDFCPALARLSYQEFVEHFLVRFLDMKHFVAGYDVHLGAHRQGNAATLKALGHELGYSFEVIPGLQELGRTVSSSAIRHALSGGDTATAAAMLGRPYALWGEVGPGDGRGRSIGYPTANITPLFEKKLLPAPGVYAVRVQLPGDVIRSGGRPGALGVVVETLPEVDRDGELLSTAPSEWVVFGGMLNFGKVPTFHGQGLAVPRVEVHILGFEGDLRGRTVKVEWLERLRSEKKFGSAAELVAQLRLDEEQARLVVGGGDAPLS